MGYLTRATIAPILIVQFAALCAASPASAISADLANKCRNMAIKAHPPPIPLGSKAYAQAERAFFSECVAKNGQMQSTEPPKDANGPK
jgi:hypothetical protein